MFTFSNRQVELQWKNKTEADFQGTRVEAKKANVQVEGIRTTARKAVMFANPVEREAMEDAKFEREQMKKIAHETRNFLSIINL